MSITACIAHSTGGDEMPYDAPYCASPIRKLLCDRKVQGLIPACSTFFASSRSVARCARNNELCLVVVIAHVFLTSGT